LETAALRASDAQRERLERELSVAHAIQDSFIPNTYPQEAGWEIAATWRAARQVGGDFYDFIRLPDGRWGMVIADVTDKGIPAALFMAMCRSLIRAAAVANSSPDETLRHVNDLLVKDTRSTMFITVFYAIWNPITGDFSYSSGGHNPPVLVKTDGTAEDLRCPGTALGVIDEPLLEMRRLTIEPGDVLAAYTDGVTEAMQDDYTEWGLERFKETLLKVNSRSADNILNEVLEEIEAFVDNAPQSDDLTMWILKRNAAE